VEDIGMTAPPSIPCKKFPLSRSNSEDNSLRTGNFFAPGDILRVQEHMDTDDQLVLAFQQGSREAFRELFERYRDPLYGFFRRRLENPGRAEELAQDCFLALLRNASRYEPRASFRSYLYGIAMNMVFAERRKSGRETAEAKALETRTEENLDAALWIGRALEQLDPGDRQILILREYEQLSYAEIAGVLRLPVNTVRSRLFRARVALKEQLMPVRGSN
jgi:RNA polymerase sigma-70 factor (ECF subfamily)